MDRPGEMHFARVRPETKGRCNRGFGQRQPCCGVITTEEVKAIVRIGQFALRQKEGRVTGYGLVKEINPFLHICQTDRAEARTQKETFGTAIEIEGGHIGGW